ncbi:hypothetical protein EJ05DRAFT_202419 [Pseudovirgaria hyperparasitica]|uniref:HIT-type domain-containing protein n=1 Tax=Pseudovirgaria hyperparasitica TaxID=470096 RepID=A0A6A6WHH1_9PEZI|nr:uncharacterized protein EJ05DRAFT_202419 [Pseudovirgaria hyperparasitica]KAF2762252.1 hypothetical protein EJ05DRAFT_202419 [Pseudovirgaria hyperparasitica]
MPSNCGICEKEVSKYKCPTCAIPYCSLTCYKPHKAAHATDTIPELQHEDQEEAQPDHDTPAPQGYASWPPDFSALPVNPKLENLLSQYPNLKDQLRSIFLKTFEPPTQDQNDSSSFRGRGRGGRYRNGRGTFRGRGRGGHGHGPWTKEKGDKAALYHMQQIENSNSEGSESLQAFVETVSELYEKEKIAFT